MTISIITATYNSGRTIADTIRSVLAQTYKDIEYWIIDGASTDCTVDIARSYEPQFKGKMHIISQPDKGLYDAMNKGIAMATGDIIGILNSDDYFTSDDAIETIARTFKENSDIDATYGDIHFINDGKPEKCVRYYSSALFSPWLLRLGFMPAHPSFYVRKHVYENYGLYSLDYKIASDYEMMVRFFHKYKLKAKYISKDFVTMRTGGVSTKNIHSRLVGTREDVMACRRNGMYTNIFFISVKYIYKLSGFIFTSRKHTR